MQSCAEPEIRTLLSKDSTPARARLPSSAYQWSYRLATENRNPRSYEYRHMSAREIVRLMNRTRRSTRPRNTQKAPSPKPSTRQEANAKLGWAHHLAGSGTSGESAAANDAAEMPPTFGVERDRFVALAHRRSGIRRQGDGTPRMTAYASIHALNELLLDLRTLSSKPLPAFNDTVCFKRNPPCRSEGRMDLRHCQQCSPPTRRLLTYRFF